MAIEQKKVITSIVNGSIIVFIGMIFSCGFNFLAKIILAKSFGPESYGMLNMALAVMVISSNISTAGINMGISRYVSVLQSKNEDIKLKKIIGAGNIFIVVAGLFMAFLIFTIAPWISVKLSRSDNLTILIRYCAFIMPFGAFLSYAHGVLRGFKDMVGIAVSNDIVNWIFIISGIGITIIYGGEIDNIPLVYLVSSLAVIVVTMYYLSKHIELSCLFSSLPFSPMGRTLLGFSWPLSLSMLTTMLRQRADILIIGYFLVASQVGLYSAALPIAYLPTVLLSGVNRILMPVASQMVGCREVEDGLQFVYSTVVRWCLIITLPVYFFIIIHSKFILLILFGNEYLGATTTLVILSIGSLFNVASGSFGEYFQAYGKTKFTLWVSILGAVSNLILMYFLIPIFGINGGAFSVTFSLIIMCVFGVYLLYKFKGILPFTREYVKTIVVAVFTLSNMAWCYSPQFSQTNRIYLIIFVGISLVSYVYGLYLSNVFNDIDKELFINFKEKLINKSCFFTK